jgi:NADPH:quinone reductase-like Zn-dependent oxidoreductase
MSTQKAIATQGPGVAEVISNYTIPSVQPDHMRINGKAFAINPTEWKSIVTDRSHSRTEGAGCDMLGIQKVGDRVAGTAHGRKFPSLLPSIWY